MSKKIGRPNKYETNVKPRLEEIKTWSKSGSTYKEIASALGIHLSTFCEYMNTYSELKESVEEFRKSGVAEVKNALFKKACGFEYEEKKIYVKKDEDGKEYKYTEITKRQSLPDVNAIAMYLRNYSEDFSDNDKINNKFKEMELELRKEMAEAKAW